MFQHASTSHEVPQGDRITSVPGGKLTETIVYPMGEYVKRETYATGPAVDCNNSAQDTYSEKGFVGTPTCNVVDCLPDLRQPTIVVHFPRLKVLANDVGSYLCNADCNPGP